jgi:hypothetical protein
MWLHCWPQHITSVWTAFHVAALLTAVHHFCLNYIPCSCTADRSASLLFDLHAISCIADRSAPLLLEIHSILLHCWPQYTTSVGDTFHFAALLTAVHHFCLNYMPCGNTADRSTSILLDLRAMWPHCWSQHITCVWTTCHVAALLTAVPQFC